MTSVEKRRSGRKSGGHRKHSDGGYSDTSSSGSFLDDTDREVSNLTDRAFRSLCIGDEAVYNDSDLCSSSPCSQKDRQLAFSQSGQDRDRGDREREELKRAAHESFTLRVQQYGQDWIHGGMYGAEIQREVYGERTQGRVSATFQHSFVETSQQEKSLREEQLSFLSNGATELSSQQRRSRSRVSSLIRVFNSEGHRVEPGDGGKLREWNDDTSWDRSALMSIQKELSEFSTPYQQNFTNDHFPSAGPFSSKDTSFYSSQVAAVAHMNSASSLMSASHSKHSMSTQVNCNSNFFIHSEFSPFKLWRDHNRFPFHQGEVSGFMQCSEFPKWYETPMYKELSLEAQPQGPYRLEERSIRHPRNDMAPMASPTPPHSTSLSAMLQKASAVEKRSESEVAGHYPQRKQMQGLGANRFPSKRPSTASPTTEMSRRVQDTISSVKALKEKIKMMTEENMETETTANQQGVLCSNDNLIPFGNNVLTVAPNVTKSNTSTTPFSISQLLTPSVHAYQEAETSEVRQCAVSPQPMEHPPVRAESRGATPDVRMSSYKSRATSLLFNLKDNRKRVKNTYSPAKFKALEKPEKNKQPSIQEPRDTVIDIPEFPDPDIQLTEIEESNRTNPALHHYVNQYQSLGLSHTTLNSQSATAHADQYSEYTLSHYQTAQMQGEMVHHSRFTGFIPENCSTNQLANGQNPHEDLMSFTPYKQGMIDNVETLGGDVYRLKSSYTATETPKQKAENNQTREHFVSKASAEQHCIETVGMEITKMDRYQQLKENKHNYSNLSSQDRWRQTNSQDTEKHSRKADISPWKQEITALIERDQHTQAYQRAATIKEELNVPRDKYRGENQQNINKELEKVDSTQSFGVGTSSHKSIGLVNPNISNQLPQYAPFSNDPMENQYYGLYQPGAIRDKCVPQKYYGYNAENEMKENLLAHNYTTYTDQEYQNKHSLYSNKDNRETDQRKQYIPVPKGHEIEQARPQFEHDMQRKSLANHDNAAATVANQVKDRLSVEVKAEQATAEHIKAQHTQAELAKAQHWAQVEQPKAESARLILADQTGSEKVKAEQSKAKLTEHEKVQQAKAEHIKEEERKGVQAEESREKQPEQGRVEKTKVEKTTVQKLAEEPKIFTEEAGAMHMKEEQVKAEQAVVERLKEEHIKSELAKTEKTRIQQAVQAKRAKIKLEQIAEEQVRAEQIEREQREAEQIRTENIKAEQVETEHRKEEEAKQEQLKDQDKTEQEKMNLFEMMKVKADNIKFKDVRQEKAAEDSIQAGQANAEKLTTQISKAKPELTKIEQTKLDLVGVELTKPENLQDRLAKPATKLSVIQQVKNEPDKVEQVKTELAKAKAELAKIKEKMRGEQKEKVRNTIIIKEDDITKIEVPLSMNINKNEEYIKQDQATQIHQQKEDSVYRRSSRDSRADDYDYLREKYGITNAVSTNRNYVSAAGNDSSNDANETPIVNTEEMKVGSLKSDNVIGHGHYVYSEFSKEFKLSSTDDLPTHLDSIANCDTVIDKMEDDSVENLENGDPKKPTDVSQQRDSDLTRLPPLERKPKSSELSVGPVKALPFPPPRALSHKEKAQSKQEILTSKIKAHAEKEISAIKEKGFAIRDGFMSKNPTKQLIDSQSINVWHRPQTQEMSKKHETTVFSHSTPKHQMEPLGIQVEPVKCVSSQSSATVSITSAPTTGKLVDYSQKQVAKELVKSDENVTEPPRDATQIRGNGKMIDDGLVENPTKENQSGINSPMQSIEQAPKNNQGKQRTNHGENYGKKKEGLEENSATSTDHLNEKKQDTSQATSLVKAESFKPMTTEKPESKLEAVHEDSASSPNLQIKTPVADNSLQIMGIMVTVREREQSENNSHTDNSTLEKINTKEEECSNSELNKSHPSSGAEVSKRNKSSEEVSIAKAKDSVVQETHPTGKEDQTEFGMNNHSENVQESSTLETRENHVSENITEKRTNLQESSSINAEPHSETQLQEQLAEKGLPSSVPAKNNVLAETQPLQYQDIITREMKDSSNKTPEENPAKEVRKDEVKRNMEEKIPQETHTNENFIAKVVNAQINCNNDSNGVDAEALVKHEAQLSVTENMTPVKNPAKSMSTDGESAPLTEEKTHDLTPLNPLNRTSPSQQLTENQNSPVSPTLQYKKTHIGEYNQVDDGVHIDSIAIKVVQAVTEKDNLKMAGKHHVTTVPSDVVVSHEHVQVASSSSEEEVNTSNNEGRTEGNKSGEQYALSSVRKESDSLEISNQQNSVTAPTENTQDENRKPENVKENGKSVDESKIQAMEGGYFQVQGVAETNNEPHNSAYFGETLDGVSKGGELPELLPYKSTLSNKSDKEVKYGAFVLDQSKRKTAESSPVCVQNENTEKEKNSEPQDKLVSKHSDVPSEKKSNNDTMEAGQAHHIRKDHIVTQSSLSARERQTSRNSQATKENAFKEKPEVKPKPKERVSTVPEISALADYARLKVIVSEERANTIQELPPNKKEGFFPLIQTRYGRRPVFTAVPKDISVNEKSLPNKTEMTAKVKKEPKAMVFPITEKEHQRTGMFKLGDKERQEKMVVNASGALDSGPQNAQCLKERNKSPTTCFKNQEKENQVAGTDTQRLCQEQSIHQPENPPVQASTSSPRVNRPRSASVSQHLKSLDNSNPYEKPEEFSSKAEKIPFFYPQPTSGQVYNLEESPTTLRKREKIENKMAKIREERKEKLRRERLDTQHEETTGQQLEEEQLSVMEVEKKHMKEESKASLAEEERRATQREEERRAKEREAITIKIRERWEKLREKDRRAVGERKAKQIEADGAAQKEEIRAQQKEEERRVKEAEERRIKNEEERREKLKKEDEEKRRLKQQKEERAIQVEQQRKAALEEQQRRDAQEKQRKRAELQEEQRKAAVKEQQRRAELEEQQRRAAVKEQQRRAAQEEQQRRAELEEQQRRAAVKEQQRRAAQEEQQRRAEQEEQQRRAEQAEQQRRAELEEEQRKAAVKEQQRRAAQEEQQRRAELEEQQRRAELEEQQRRAELQEEQRKAAVKEQQRRAAQEEQQRRAAQEEQQRRAELQRRAAQEEQQKRAVQEEQHQRAALEEEQRKAALKEQQRRAAVNEQQRRATPLEPLRRAELEEQQRKSDIEEQQWRPALEEEQQRAALEEQKKRAEQREQQMRAAQKEKKRIAALKEQQQRAALIEEQMQAKQIEEKILTETGEEKKRTQREEEGREAEKEKAIIKQSKEGMTRRLEENQAAIKEEEKTVAREWPQSQREDEVRAKKTEAEEKSAGQREKETDTQIEEQKRAVQRTDSLQYYAITSTESERKPKERQLCSPSPSQQRKTPSRVESIEDSGPHTRPFRPHGAASPAPSLPRSNTSSPALGVKPSMFRVKDNTIRGFSFTKSVKPRFHKNFGGDFRVGSPMDRGFERGEEEQEIMRRSAGIPDRLAAIKELSTFQPSFSSQDYSAHLPQHRPYSRRSIVLDEDDSRSIFSNISEDVESFATAVDLADVRGLYDYERPESACSFSSDVSRSLGKPPVVPPKSEKALRRAKRLTTRRIKKELCKAAADSPAGVEKPLQEVSSIPPSTATEVRSSNCHAVASPHFSSPVSLAHAPALGSSLPSSHTEHQASRRSVHASPHATGPISLPAASPHATAPVTLPVAPSHATGPASRTAAPKTVAHVPSSPTFHHANHPAPVTQYHVESGYPQTYPLTQRKVLQDVGSGQYFVVDVPVQVKTKTFFDPETGKYVKLNVRESGQSTSQPQPQQTYPKPQLQSQIQVKPQQPLSRASPAGKPFVLYQGYNDYSQGYQPAGMNLVPPHRSSDPVTLHQDKQPFRENCSHGHSAPEIRQDSEEHRYSPEKTPYMDTVNDTEKTYNTVYNTHGSHEAFPECDTNSQLAVSSVCENDNSAHSPYQPRDIITMSELEDFMEVSDW